MGSNLCVPGYGAFLSTYYLGFKDISPDIAGIAVSTAALVIQIFMPLMMTGFKINILLWERDSDILR